MPRARSEMWDHVKEVTDNDGKVGYVCIHCPKDKPTVIPASATRIRDHILGVEKALRVSESVAVQNFLNALKTETEELVRPLTDSWATTSCTISVDGWSCLKSRGLVCVLAHSDTAPVIVNIVDSKLSKKTGSYLSDLIRTSIVKEGDNKVIQVVMDNASNNKSAAAILSEGYPSIFFTNCAAHCLDLMLHDMGKIGIVKKVLTQVHRIVMMVKGSASAVALFRTIFSKLELVRPGTTRFGTQVIMVTRFLEVKEQLRQLVISDQWKEVAVSKTEDAKKIRKLLLDDIFWESVKSVAETDDCRSTMCYEQSTQELL
ncbi:unnamed protein product [Closterium sp. Yama58-4]|nr:unnamed protein product [Closterium sp. Yama58-4]